MGSTSLKRMPSGWWKSAVTANQSSAITPQAIDASAVTLTQKSHG